MFAITSLPSASAPEIEAATELLAAATSDAAAVRVLGGVGVALRCPTAGIHGSLARPYSDIDLITTRGSVPVLSQILAQRGYLPEKRFNATHGHSRMMFHHPDGIHVDVFVDQFVMCHRLDLSSRLALDGATVTLADLLLTKLQIAELNEKDVTDSAALFLDHELSEDEGGINVDYVVGVLGRDWGWWRTVTDNLRSLPLHLTDRLPNGSTAQVARRVKDLLERIDEAPKSLRWRARAKAGEKLPWRDEPEESH